MNVTIRRILTANSLSRRLYCAARQAFNIHRAARSAGRYFVNADEFKSALRAHRGSALVNLRTADGLSITMRHNCGDAMALSEIFLDDCYVRDLTLPHNPVVIVIGGFIGDFSLYAVKRLNARKVIVCEPSPRNWALLVKNIRNNGYEDRIEPVHKAITDGGNALMNIDAPDEYQCMVSAYCPSEQAVRVVSGISRGQLLRDHAVESIDLLKIDCEGGEYAILESTSADVLSRIQNIVFEYHDIDGGWASAYFRPLRDQKISALRRPIKKSELNQPSSPSAVNIILYPSYRINLSRLCRSPSGRKSQRSFFQTFGQRSGRFPAEMFAEKSVVAIPAAHVC